MLNTTLDVDLEARKSLPPSPVAAASTFWPPSDSYNIAFLKLYLDHLPAGYRLRHEDLLHLVSLGNALRSIQRADGTFLNEEGCRQLLKTSHDVLLRLAADTPARAVSSFLQTTAENLVGGLRTIQEASQISPEKSDLILICGPLATWDWKATSSLHSVILGLVDTAWSATFERMDGQLEEVGRYLGERLGVGALFPTKEPRLIAADILLCGGEADTFPKQFAYFLAEDTRVFPASQPGEVVLFFTNVYHERFRRLSLPLYEILAGRLAGEERRCVEEPHWLLRWFKGHDVSHFWSLVPGQATRLPDLEDHAGGGLHEAMADILGYLSLLGPWSPTGQADPFACGVVFLSEMLRYLRRGISFFPDSHAAFIEFCYLVKNGFSRFNPDTGLLEWTPEGVEEGMRQLAGKVIRAVLQGDQAEREEILTVYGPEGNPELGVALAQAFGRAAHLPTDVGFQLA